MCRSSRAPLLLAAIAIAWTRPALADPPPEPPSLEQVEAARAPFREARALHRQGKLGEAIARMLDAYHLASTPVLALEVGRLLVEAARLVEARDLLRGVAALPTSPRESDAGREARQEAALLATELDARISRLSLAGRPPGVDVLLDGRPLAPADPASWQGVDPGDHAITMTIDDHPCAQITVTVGERDARTIDLRSAAPACRPASAPPPLLDAPRPGLEDREGGSSAPSRWGGEALAGAGAVAVGIGTYLLVRAKADYDKVSSECTPRGCNADGFAVRHAAHQQANVATVLVGVGAAAVGGGLLWFALGGPKRAGAAPPRVGVGPRSVSLEVPLP
jgi:hypothetical protein